ncbi:hypothetical protein ELQ90_01725 [Labedella phragmitis]|uniref:Uncharacterized protein n=1 Tax=Labedella phragmitis TaxID=2498849 RepID=A0A444PXW4_9MICO|nr:hypothetical protein [Labedella phragmitis]RWZ52693.1 hypothetical protein ELQ90_01725 [Labedella phragmitis]
MEKRSQQERDDLARKQRQERRDRFVAWVGAVGALIAVVGVVVTGNQNRILTEQLEAQREAHRVDGAVLVGVAEVVLDYPTANLWEVDGKGIERTFGAGEHADGSMQIRVEVTNAGRSAGSVTTAAVQFHDGWLPAESLFCGRIPDGEELVDCDLPLIVGEAETKVFTFRLPTAPACVETPPADSPLTVSFETAAGDRFVMRTGLTATLELPCPVPGGD